MKFFKKDVVILLTLLIVAGIACLLPQAKSVFDIQMHDTYLVLDTRTIILWMLGILLFLIFIVRAITTRFSSLAANIGLLLGLIILGWLRYIIITIVQSFIGSP